MRKTLMGASPRRGFTLIELLVVIAIIAVLMALLMPAVMRAWSVTTPTQCRSEIKDMEGAISSFKQEFKLTGPTFPSSFVLHKYAYHKVNDAKAIGFLTTMFGNSLFSPHPSDSAYLVIGPNGQGVDWNGTGMGNDADVQLTGEQCLVFFLGGCQATLNGLPTCLGYSRDPTNPAAGLANGTASQRITPFYNFKSARLVKGANNYFMYAAPFTGNNNAPTSYYAYFAVGKNGYDISSSQGAAPYLEAPNKLVNANGYQILCAGQDGAFGSTSATQGTWTSDKGTSTSAAGRDDLANFARGLLGGIN